MIELLTLVGRDEVLKMLVRIFDEYHSRELNEDICDWHRREGWQVPSLPASIEQVSFAKQHDPRAGLWSDYSPSPVPICYKNESSDREYNEYRATFFYSLPDTWLTTWGFDVVDGEIVNLSCWAD